MKTLDRVFKERLFKFDHFSSVNELRDYLDRDISHFDTIAFGGSKTLEELELYEFFEERGNRVNWHWKGQPVEDSDQADVYFTSANALARDGAIYLTDGNANRLRNVLDQSKRVIVVCGTNKLVRNAEEAIERIENVAAVKNAQRLDMDPEEICNYWLAVTRNKLRNIEVIVLDGDYGY